MGVRVYVIWEYVCMWYASLEKIPIVFFLDTHILSPSFTHAHTHAQGVARALSLPRSRTFSHSNTRVHIHIQVPSIASEAVHQCYGWHVSLSGVLMCVAVCCSVLQCLAVCAMAGTFHSQVSSCV